jgi:hypothetical protein
LHLGKKKKALQPLREKKKKSLATTKNKKEEKKEPCSPWKLPLFTFAEVTLAEAEREGSTTTAPVFTFAEVTLEEVEREGSTTTRFAGSSKRKEKLERKNSQGRKNPSRQTLVGPF